MSSTKNGPNFWAHTHDGRLAALTIIEPYAFFWGQWPSNFQTSPFQLDGQRYFCVEQWMMAEKARVFADQETREKILSATKPAECKALGREVRGYVDETWAALRVQVVQRGTVEKYRQNPELFELLKATGDLQFVECSPYDRIWGIGMNTDHPNLMDTSRWGQNLLGKTIDNARRILLAGE